MTTKKKRSPIAPVKGRPMLNWVGKHPPEAARYFPPQLKESFGVELPFPSEQQPTFQNFLESKHNLLFHGDNKEILSTLLGLGYGGHIDLIYIDPPFDSGADYVRQIKLRGSENIKPVLGEEHSWAEQVQYTDIWANDNYLQFMYERLILLRALLSNQGSIYVHCDENKNHHLRMLLDEVFGADNFRREIIWDITVLSGYKITANNWIRGHDTIYYYTKSNDFIFNKLYQPHDEKYLSTFDKEDENGKYLVAHRKKRYKKDVEEKGKPFGDVWDGIKSFQQQPTAKENVQYPTQKPETLLERIITASSNEGSIVLDCFAGSGTTAVVAQSLGRRWIMADLNKGAVQTMMKRLQGRVEKDRSDNGRLLEGAGYGFAHYGVNNYDARLQCDYKNIIARKYGVQKNPNDMYFDGRINDSLVKIADLGRALTKLDIELVNDEIKKHHPHETRDIYVICNGIEPSLLNDVEQDNRKRPVNKLIIKNIQSDGLITFKEPAAKVSIRKNGKRATVIITEYISPMLLARLSLDRTIFDEEIDDFRSQIDCVLIDTDYNGSSFNIVCSDVPSKKNELIEGKYELQLPRVGSKVAVKIVDMLGEEVLTAK